MKKAVSDESSESVESDYLCLTKEDEVVEEEDVSFRVFLFRNSTTLDNISVKYFCSCCFLNIIQSIMPRMSSVFLFLSHSKYFIRYSLLVYVKDV